MVDMILDDSITVKASMGIPGGGKTYLFLVYGLDKILNGKEKYEKLIYIKNNVEIGEKLGALPGTIEEKLDPWNAVLYGILGGKEIVENLKEEGKIETPYLGHTLGITYDNSWIVIDDCQQLSKPHIYNLVTRLGKNSVICFAGDVFQIYSKKYAGFLNNGITMLHNELKGEEFFASVHTKISERSETAQRCAELLFNELD